MGDCSVPELLVPRFSVDKERSYDSLEGGDVKPVRIKRKFACKKYTEGVRVVPLEPKIQSQSCSGNDIREH